MFFGSVKRTKSVVAAELAALVAFRVLKQGDRVGGVVFADQGTDVILPKRDRRNILRLLERIVSRNRELERSQPVDFERALHDTILKIRNMVTHDFLVVIISDFHRYSPDVIKNIAQISQHNDVILAKITDPMEQDIPHTRFIAGDHETQIRVDGTSEKLRNRFHKGFDTDYQSFKDQMKKHRIPVFMIHTTAPLDQQIKDIFKGGKR